MILHERSDYSANMLRPSLAALLVICLVAAAMVAVALHPPTTRTELVDPSLVDRFLADQAALDKTSSTAQGLQQIEDENLAEGDGLSAGMQQHSTAGLGALTGVDDNTARALRAADGAIDNAGLKSGSGSLLGDLTGTQLQAEMSDGGMPTARNNAHVGESLKQELDASRKELAAVSAGGNGAKFADKDMGLSESALNSVAEGMEDGLDASRVDPTTGLASGQLALAPSTFSQTLAQREMRHVAGGKMQVGGTLTGLVSADEAFSGAASPSELDADGVDDGSIPASRAEQDGGVQQRALARLQHELKNRQALVARLGLGRRGSRAPPSNAAAWRHGAPTAAAHAAHASSVKHTTRKVVQGSKGSQTRTVSMLKKELQERQRQLKIMASAKTH